MPDGVKKVLALRDGAVGALGPLVGSVLGGPELQQAAWALARALGLSGRFAAVRESLVPHLGRTLDPALAREVAWRLAGNRPALRAGRAVRPWAGQAACEWAPVQVTGVWPRRRLRDGKARPGYWLRVRFLAGSACPLEAHAWWSHEMAAVGAREVGFGVYRAGDLRREQEAGRVKHYFDDGREFFGLRFQVELDPELCRSGPAWRAVRATGTLAAHNKALLARRAREGWRCPYGYGHACWACPEGLDRCPAAVRVTGLTVKECRACGRTARHEAGCPSAACLDCAPYLDGGCPLPKKRPEGDPA